MQTKILPLKQLPTKKQRHELFGSVQPAEKTKPIEKNQMADIQNTKKDFLFHLDAVGISNVKYPVIITSKVNPEFQTSIGTFKFSSSLSNTSKGTNMSRFMEHLNHFHEQGNAVNVANLSTFAKELSERLDQKDATIDVSFPWFFERKGPNSGLSGLNHAEAGIRVTYHQEDGYTATVSLSGQITTLCPCSKEISEYSAHNQRGEVSMEATLTENFNEEETDWKEMLLEAAESNASARLHPVLKRPDEKMVTEQAYENPRFVEDIVRLVAADLYEMPFVARFKVSCRNEESIHLHDAIASISFDKLNDTIE
ncbi:GTP cyclohydrolase FolE2 [Oceanobacillus massiliensis]|uniref:GTP cyclohydrolase FolE2 n=1 Tax=Oceanobacillus massiliensis TaxID=1465765 RepID=UPI000288D850|nr:GTP cyclohydrolase FolE2 [Oceanobacillus massiliensis]